MTLIEALSQFFIAIVNFLKSITVPGFDFNFLSLFIGIFAIAALIEALSLILNFGSLSSESKKR